MPQTGHGLDLTILKHPRKLIHSKPKHTNMKIGGIDIAESIVNLEYQQMRTQKILEWIVKNNVKISTPSQSQMDKIDRQVVEDLKRKYPDAGIEQQK